MLSALSIKYRSPRIDIILDVHGLQISKRDAWDFSWTPEHHWRLDFYRDGKWLNVWHWDRREHLLPAFGPHPATVWGG